MIGFIEEQGFYAVSDGSLHCFTERRRGIRKTSLSLLVTGKPVEFGDKKANVIFCLASRDSGTYTGSGDPDAHGEDNLLIHDLVRCRTKEEATSACLTASLSPLTVGG